MEWLGVFAFSVCINRSKSVLLIMIILVTDLRKWHAVLRFQDAYFYIVIYAC